MGKIRHRLGLFDNFRVECEIVWLIFEKSRKYLGKIRKIVVKLSGYILIVSIICLRQAEDSELLSSIKKPSNEQIFHEYKA